MIFREVFGLNYDPFAPGSPAVLAEPVKAAFAQITAELERGVRAIVVAGAPGSGKTLLLTLLEDSFMEQSCSVSRVDVAAFVSAASDANADLLLVDEADSADPSVLSAWLSQHRETRRTSVLACRTEAAARLCDALSAAAIHLTALSPAQAKDFIVERVTKAGRADLFTSAALSSLIEASGGSAQALRSLAGMAMFWAAYAQTSQIDVAHVEEAARSQSLVSPKEARSEDVALSGERERSAQNTQAMPLRAEPAPEETAVLAGEPTVEDAAIAEFLVEAPVAEEPALSASLADVVFQPRPERRSRVRAFPLRPFLAAAAILLAAVPISASVLLDREQQRPPPVKLTSATPPRVTRAPVQTAEDRLRAFDRVAKATLPGRVLLAIVPQGPLSQPSTVSFEKRAAPVAQPARRSTSTLAAAAAPAPLPPSVTSIAGSQAMIASLPVSPPPVARAPAAPEREAPQYFRQSPSQFAARDEGERGINDAPFRSAPLPPPPYGRPRYMSANAMALALLDISEQAGLRDDDEFTAFRSCVFRRVSPGAAEEAAFWRAVETCLR